MTTRDVTIGIKQGAETSPVAKCVQVASQFESRIYVEFETKKVNAKSIMGMMNFQASDGQEVTIQAEGPDQEEAIEAMVRCLTGKE